jgi:hypothetical protein
VFSLRSVTRKLSVSLCVFRAPSDDENIIVRLNVKIWTIFENGSFDDDHPYALIEIIGLNLSNITEINQIINVQWIKKKFTPVSDLKL